MTSVLPPNPSLIPRKSRLPLDVRLKAASVHGKKGADHLAAEEHRTGVSINSLQETQKSLKLLSSTLAELPNLQTTPSQEQAQNLGSLYKSNQKEIEGLKKEKEKLDGLPSKTKQQEVHAKLLAETIESCQAIDAELQKLLPKDQLEASKLSTTEKPKDNPLIANFISSISQSVLSPEQTQKLEVIGASVKVAEIVHQNISLMQSILSEAQKGDVKTSSFDERMRAMIDLHQNIEEHKAEWLGKKEQVLKEELAGFPKEVKESFDSHKNGLAQVYDHLLQGLDKAKSTIDDIKSGIDTRFKAQQALEALQAKAEEKAKIGTKVEILDSGHEVVNHTATMVEMLKTHDVITDKDGADNLIGLHYRNSLVIKNIEEDLGKADKDTAGKLQASLDVYKKMNGSLEEIFTKHGTNIADIEPAEKKDIEQSLKSLENPSASPKKDNASKLEHEERKMQFLHDSLETQYYVHDSLFAKLKKEVPQDLVPHLEQMQKTNEALLDKHKAHQEQLGKDFTKLPDAMQALSTQIQAELEKVSDSLTPILSQYSDKQAKKIESEKNTDNMTKASFVTEGTNHIISAFKEGLADHQGAILGQLESFATLHQGNSALIKKLESDLDHIGDDKKPDLQKLVQSYKQMNTDIEGLFSKDKDNNDVDAKKLLESTPTNQPAKVEYNLSDKATIISSSLSFQKIMSTALFNMVDKQDGYKLSSALSDSLKELPKTLSREVKAANIITDHNHIDNTVDVISARITDILNKVSKSIETPAPPPPAPRLPSADEGRVISSLQHDNKLAVYDKEHDHLGNIQEIFIALAETVKDVEIPKNLTRNLSVVFHTNEVRMDQLQKQKEVLEKIEKGEIKPSSEDEAYLKTINKDGLSYQKAILSDIEDTLKTYQETNQKISEIFDASKATILSATQSSLAIIDKDDKLSPLLEAQAKLPPVTFVFKTPLTEAASDNVKNSQEIFQEFTLASSRLALQNDLLKQLNEVKGKDENIPEASLKTLQKNLGDAKSSITKFQEDLISVTDSFAKDWKDPTHPRQDIIDPLSKDKQHHPLFGLTQKQEERKQNIQGIQDIIEGMQKQLDELLAYQKKKETPAPPPPPADPVDVKDDDEEEVPASKRNPRVKKEPLEQVDQTAKDKFAEYAEDIKTKLNEFNEKTFDPKMQEYQALLSEDAPALSHSKRVKLKLSARQEMQETILEAERQKEEISNFLKPYSADVQKALLTEYLAEPYNQCNAIINRCKKINEKAEEVSQTHKQKSTEARREMRRQSPYSAQFAQYQNYGGMDALYGNYSMNMHNRGMDDFYLRGGYSGYPMQMQAFGNPYQRQMQMPFQQQFAQSFFPPMAFNSMMPFPPLNLFPQSYSPFGGGIGGLNNLAGGFNNFGHGFGGTAFNPFIGY